MATMNISLPHALRAWVEETVKAGSYATASDYVRDLVRRDQERQVELARLNELLDEGERSGIDPRPVKEIVEDVIARGRARHVRKAVNG